MTIRRRRNVGVSTAAVLGALMMTMASSGQILFVDDDAPAAGDGLTWNTAYRFLRDALDTAALGGVTEIRVAQGTYFPDMEEATPLGSGNRFDPWPLLGGVSVVGGYAGIGAPDPDARDITLFESVLSGDLLENDTPALGDRQDNSQTLFEAGTLTAPATFEGFTFISAYEDDTQFKRGAVFDLLDGDLIVRDSRFVDNFVAGSGPCLWIDMGSAQFERCSFIENQGAGDGGALVNVSADLSVVDCSFIQNQARIGGAIRVNGSGELFVNRCRFIGNIGTFNAGAIDHGNPGLLTVLNSLFSGNQAQTNIAGAIGAAGHELHVKVFRNCTFVNNFAPNDGGVRAEGVVTVDSCIFWNNSDNGGLDQDSNFFSLSAPAVNYSNIQGLNGSLGGLGNIGADPQFVDADGVDNIVGTDDDDLHLLAGSPSIDSGDPNLLPTPGEFDLGGDLRVQSCRVDMGAFETLGGGVDCNSNGINDGCEISSGLASDCNNNAIPDGCDIAALSSIDCNLDGVPDECELATHTGFDCNANGQPDDCDIADQTSADGNTNGVPDECEQVIQPSDEGLAKLYWAGQHKILSLTTDGSVLKILVNDALNEPVGIAVGVTIGKLFLADRFVGQIQTVNLDGTGRTSIVTGLGSPTGVAYDPVASMVYWTEQSPPRIRRATFGGTNVETIIVGTVGAPYGIAVDPIGGQIYWTDTGFQSVHRANLDGSNPELLASGFTNPGGIAVDPGAGKIYWTDSPAFETGLPTRIIRSNLDGSTQEDVIVGAFALFQPHFITLAPATGKMYWTDHDDGGIFWANLDGTGQASLGVGGTRPHGIVVDETSGKVNWTDPLGSVGSRMARSNLNGTLGESLEPGPFNVRKDIAVDVAGGKMYWTEEPDASTGLLDRIMRSDLDGTNVEVIVPGEGNLAGDPDGIDLDLVNGKVYWIARSTGVRRANLDGSDPEQVPLVPDLLVFPRDIVVDPIGGKLYVGSRQSQDHIVWANLDGSGAAAIVDSGGCAEPQDLTLDHVNGKLYWIGDCSDTLRRSNLDGTNVETLVTGLIGGGGANGIAIDNGAAKVYWTDPSQVYRANLDGSDPEIVLSADNILGSNFDGITVLPADCNCNAQDDTRDIVLGLSLDADGNGIPDECDDACLGVSNLCAIAAGLSPDCNSNLIPDDCEVADGTALDCNANGILDSCDLTAGSLFSSESPVLSPIGNGASQNHTILNAPTPLGGANIILTASADLLTSVRSISVRINGFSVSTAFTTGAGTCSNPPDVDMIAIPLVLLEFVFDQDLVIDLVPSLFVDAAECGGASTIQVRMEYSIVGATDTNGNGVLDECESLNCPADTDDDGGVGINDFLRVLAEWGVCGPICRGDTDGDGTVGILDFLGVLADWGPCP